MNGASPIDRREAQYDTTYSRRGHSPRLIGVRLWIIVCALASTVGWALAAVGGLRRASYVAVLAIVAAMSAIEAFVSGRYARSVRRSLRLLGDRLRSCVRRLAKPVPAAYFALCAAALIGGSLYAPNNYDALTYRLPRILHWISDRRWSWLSTPNPRMNYSGTGAEWLMTGLLLLFESDRVLFMFNFVPYVLLPGLVYLTYRRLEVPRRAAWFWMWLVPCAYCFAMQAGGIGNDAFAALFVLASVYFALEARRTGAVADAWFALLSTGLLAGVKASNLPLVLPAAVALWPSRGLLWRSRWRTLPILGIAATISFIPNAVLNQLHSGSWTGDPSNRDGLQLSSPVSGFVGNTVEVLAQAVQPPFAPSADRLRSGLEHLLPARLDSKLRRDFPRYAPTVGELPQEEAAGLGIGISALLLLSCVATLTRRGRQGHKVAMAHSDGRDIDTMQAPRRLATNSAYLVTASACLAGGVFFAKMGSEAAARLLTPYYPLLIVPLLRSDANAVLARLRWWRAAAAIAAWSAIIGVVLSPSRPLVPVRAAVDALLQHFPDNRYLMRARDVYGVYAQRDHSLEPVVSHLPVNVNEVGLIVGPDDAEATLWRPYGSRRFEHVIRPGIDDTRFEWVVGTTTALASRYGPLDSWLAASGRSLVATDQIRTKASSPAKTWFVARLTHAGLAQR